MPDLTFHVEGAEAVKFAAAPMLALKLRIVNTVPEERVHAILLRCQVQIEAARRNYNSDEKDNLYDLFGEPAEWGRTLRSVLWTQTHTSTPGFTESTLVELSLPCSYDFTAAANKYFYALEDGEIPLTLLFSGSLFYAADHAAFQVTQIPWEKEATFRLPLSVWRETMEHYFPGSVWLSLQRDTFDRLLEYKGRAGLLTWEQAVQHLLDQNEAPLPQGTT